MALLSQYASSEPTPAWWSQQLLQDRCGRAHRAWLSYALPKMQRHPFTQAGNATLNIQLPPGWLHVWLCFGTALSASLLEELGAENLPWRDWLFLHNPSIIPDAPADQVIKFALYHELPSALPLLTTAVTAPLWNALPVWATSRLYADLLKSAAVETDYLPGFVYLLAALDDLRSDALQDRLNVTLFKHELSHQQNLHPYAQVVSQLVSNPTRSLTSALSGLSAHLPASVFAYSLSCEPYDADDTLLVAQVATWPIEVQNAYVLQRTLAENPIRAATVAWSVYRQKKIKNSALPSDLSHALLM